MFRRIADAALKADHHIAGRKLLPKDSVIRYAIPFMPDPIYDNSKVIKEYTDIVAKKSKDFSESEKDIIKTSLYDLQIPNKYINLELRNDKLYDKNAELRSLAPIAHIGLTLLGFCICTDVIHVQHPALVGVVVTTTVVSLFKSVCDLGGGYSKTMDTANYIELVMDRATFKKSI